MQKRSIGVTITGLILLILGTYNFLTAVGWSITFFQHDSMLMKSSISRHEISETLKKTGVSISEFTDSMFRMYEVMVRENLLLALNIFIITPLLAFVLILGGIGVLRLQEHWRRSAVFIYALFLFSNLVSALYSLCYYTSMVIIGLIVDPKARQVTIVIDEIRKLFNSIPPLIITKLLIAIAGLCLLIYFLTQPKVREQFKK